MAEFAHEQLARLLDADLPSGVDALDEADTAKLVRLINSSLDSQQAEVRRAERDLLSLIPLPFRGAVKRILK